MNQPIVMVAFAVAFALVVLLWVAARSFISVPWGKLALAAGGLLVPLLVSVGGIAVGVQESSRTRFCMDCHEMEGHGKSLFVDNPRALAAVHYQNRLVDRDSICYDCHRNYALFGDLHAKINGLKHVWVHYFGEIPETFELYSPYPNSNCLHCHEDARRFLEHPAHRPQLAAMMKADVDDQVSCLGCHNITHDMKSVKEGNFWAAELGNEVENEVENAASPSLPHPQGTAP